MTIAHNQFILDGEVLVGINAFIDSDDQLWFKARKIASFLNVDVNRNVLKCNRKSWRKVGKAQRYNQDFPPKTTFVNESGLFQLMVRSDNVKLFQFHNWVFTKLLPLLRNIANQKPLEQKMLEKADSSVQAGHIYLATNSHLEQRKLYKISSTKDVNECIKQLNSASPVDWYTLRTFFTLHRSEDEASVQTSLQKCRRNRDFFEFESQEDAICKCELAFKDNKF